MTAPADRLLDALARSAATRYGGEVVSELEHALQCAELAREGGADEELQLACLLHDVGRYAVDQSLVSDTTERTPVGSSARLRLQSISASRSRGSLYAATGASRQ